MSIQNIATSSTLNFNLNGVKTHVFGLQGAPFQATPYLMDFRNLTVEEFRFTPRGAYIDNTKSANPVTLQMQPIGMQITVPAGALWAIHWPAPKQSWLMVSSNSVGTDITNIWFVDYPVMPYKTDSTVSIAGPIAVTQSGTWNVGVNNFPASQVVSGSVSVSNFPATQAVSGSVSVSNFPATQSIAGTVAATQGTSPWIISGTVQQGGSNWSQNIAQWGGSSTTLGQKTSANSLPVTLASDIAELLQSTSAVQVEFPNTVAKTYSSSVGKNYLSYIALMFNTYQQTAGNPVLTITDGGGLTIFSFTLPLNPTASTLIFITIPDLSIPLTSNTNPVSAVFSIAFTGGNIGVILGFK